MDISGIQITSAKRPPGNRLSNNGALRIGPQQVVGSSVAAGAKTLSGSLSLGNPSVGNLSLGSLSLGSLSVGNSPLHRLLLGTAWGSQLANGAVPTSAGRILPGWLQGLLLGQRQAVVQTTIPLLTRLEAAAPLLQSAISQPLLRLRRSPLMPLSINGSYSLSPQPLSELFNPQLQKYISTILDRASLAQPTIGEVLDGSTRATPLALPGNVATASSQDGRTAKASQRQLEKQPQPYYWDLKKPSQFGRGKPATPFDRLPAAIRLLRFFRQFLPASVKQNPPNLG